MRFLTHFLQVAPFQEGRITRSTTPTLEEPTYEIAEIICHTALLLAMGLSVHADHHAGETVKLGVLHSLSGTMAISEVSLRDVVPMAV